MTVGDWARLLYTAGAVLAIAGPGIAAIRLVRKYLRAKTYGGTFDDFDRMTEPHAVKSGALRDATWGVVEFGLVGIGVLLASVASMLLIP